jgi:hypothetical protein
MPRVGSRFVALTVTDAHGRRDRLQRLVSGPNL